MGGLALLGVRAVAVRLAIAAEAIVALRGERGVAILVVAVDGHLHDGALAGDGSHSAVKVARGVVEGAPHTGSLIKRPLAVIVERACSHYDVETVQRQLDRRVHVDPHICHGSQEIGYAAYEARDKRQARRNRGDASAFDKPKRPAAFLRRGAPCPADASFALLLVCGAQGPSVVVLS